MTEYQLDSRDIPQVKDKLTLHGNSPNNYLMTTPHVWPGHRLPRLQRQRLTLHRDSPNNNNLMTTPPSEEALETLNTLIMSKYTELLI